MTERALVTGGATGLGLAIAEVLVGAGYDVVIAGRREAVLTEAASLIGARAIVADVTDAPGRLIAAAGPINHLVNNAGSFIPGLVTDWRAADFERMHQVHVVAPAMLAQAFAAQAGEGASIVNVASTLAERPAAGTGPYAVAKAGMVGLTRVLALELAPRGIRANAILPGVIATDLRASAPAKDGGDYAARMAAIHPLGRLGSPRDVADAALWLIRAGWVTGAAIAVDGGLMLSWGREAGS